MGMPKIPSPPTPAPAPPPLAQSQLSSTAVLGSAENQQIAAARASGRGFSGTILTGPGGLFNLSDTNPTPKAKPQLIGS